MKLSELGVNVTFIDGSGRAQVHVSAVHRFKVRRQSKECLVFTNVTEAPFESPQRAWIRGQEIVESVGKKLYAPNKLTKKFDVAVDGKGAGGPMQQRDAAAEG